MISDRIFNFLRWAMLIVFLLMILGMYLADKLQNVSAEPEIQIVSSTTYVPYENGQVIARFLNSKFDEISTNCTATILYPDKSVFIYNQMTAVSPLGNYYINFSVPDVFGVYEYSVQCWINNKNISGSKAFEVTSLKNAIINFTNSSVMVITDLISNQTIFINDSQNYQNVLITNLSNQNINISNNIFNYLTQNLTNLTIYLNQTLVDNMQLLNQTLNVQIGYNDSNFSVKYMLSGIYNFLGIKPFNWSVYAQAPAMVRIGELWSGYAFVVDQYNNTQDDSFANCDISSNFFPISDMAFESQYDRWKYSFIPSSSGVIYYNVNCSLV